MIKDNKKNKWILPALFFIFLLAVILKSAWVSDDAFISFRYVKNLFNGYGLRWNITERVQAFTNPLYVFLIIPLYGLTKNMYLSSIVLSVGLTMSAVIIGLYPKGRRNIPLLAVAIAVLSISKAFIDYSTSGLENPVTFFILILFYNEFLFKDSSCNNKSFFALCLLACMGALNRIDTVLFFAPALIYSFFKNFKAKKILLGLLGFLPFLLWEIFSFVYYGSFVPNTAIAKLNNATSLLHNLYTGARYIISTYIYGDFITSTVIFGAIVLGIFLLIKKKYKYALAILGIFLYMLYIMYIGGDFMVGRHLSAPFFLSVYLFYNVANDYLSVKTVNLKAFNKIAATVCVVLIVLGSLAPTSTVTAKIKYSNSRIKAAINLYTTPLDERKFYYYDAGLLYYLANTFTNGYDSNRPVYVSGRQGAFLSPDEVSIQGAIGFMGYFAPSEVKFIDYLALADPMLARIPAAPNQRVGHYKRPIPEGYVESVETGTNMIEDVYLKQYYDKVLIITRGELFSKERFNTIVNMMLGRYDYLMDEYIKSDEYQNYLNQYKSQK